jgi:outer membrane murein-binding lipoprotein Lpp
VREQKAGARPPKETLADEAAELRAQVAALRQKVDALTAENAALKEQLGV